MKLTRFEILLPLNYNDVSSIEPEKFLLTHRELFLILLAFLFPPEI